MVQSSSAAVLEGIRNPSSSVAQQITSLKQLKNDIVGHEQRKELVVKQGIIEPLVHILSTASTANGKRIEAKIYTWTDEDEASLQATLILGSLANGGRAFVPPLLAAGTVQHLLDNVTVDGETTPRLVTASLQALRSLAASASSTSAGENGSEQPLLDIFSKKGTIELFQQLLLLCCTQQQLTPVLEIIALSATASTSTRWKLADAGVLNTLASRLQAHALSTGHIEASHAPRTTGDLYPLPPSSLPAVLSAISAIIDGSDYRAQCFILSPPMRELFDYQRTHDNNGATFGARQNPTEHLLPSLHIPAFKSVSFHNHTTSRAFPALGTLQSSQADRVDGRTPQYLEQSASDYEHANAVCAYLIYLARSTTNFTRLVAVKLLAQLHNSLENSSHLLSSSTLQRTSSREREKQIGLLAVPLAVNLINDAVLVSTRKAAVASSSAAQEREEKVIKEQACEVLGMLVQGSKELQVAAVEAGAVKRICPMLKKSFDHVSLAKPMWSARSSGRASDGSGVESAKLGSRGLPQEIVHAMKIRESTLSALAALAKKEDLHRKAIVDAGVVGLITDALKPLPRNFASSMDPRHTGAKESFSGNTVGVLIAACHLAQALSRSVALLRTSLIDAGVAGPVASLMTYKEEEEGAGEGDGTTKANSQDGDVETATNVQVKIAATDVCCNLLLDFSPMREELVKLGVIGTLTRHAREEEAGLRLSSLWALKHLVLHASREIKGEVLEGLTLGWLVRAMEGSQQQQQSQQRDSGGGGGVSIGGLSTPNAAGEQVDLLNPTVGMGMEIDSPHPHAHLGHHDDELEEDVDSDGELFYDESSATHYHASQLRSTLQPQQQPHASTRTSAGFNPPPGSSGHFASSAHVASSDPTHYLSTILQIETSPVLASARNDVNVQEQALDFVRNLLSGDDCAYMSTLLMDKNNGIGAEKLFSIFNEKLAPLQRNLGAPSGGSLGGSNRPLYQPTALILSAIHVLNHLAASTPEIRGMVVANATLLKNWLPHFSHPDRRVRVVSVWAVTSLTWIMDEGDRASAKGRISALSRAGIEARVRSMAEDPDADVRERVRTAVRQMEGS